VVDIQGMFTLTGCVSEPSKFLLKIVSSRLSFTEKWPHLTELPVVRVKALPFIALFYVS
jgi:hypothetical protein